MTLDDVHMLDNHGNVGYTEAMTLEYNSKNKNRLSIRQRYGKRSNVYESNEEDR